MYNRTQSLKFLCSSCVSSCESYIKQLERVQRRATKMADAKGMQFSSERFSLQRLEDRRIRGDLIQFFKFENQIDLINCRKPLGKMGIK